MFYLRIDFPTKALKIGATKYLSDLNQLISPNKKHAASDPSSLYLTYACCNKSL